MEISISKNQSGSSLFSFTPETTMALISAFIGVVGALLGSGVAAIQTNRFQNRNRALLFFREFNSREMSEHRDKAYGFVSENPFFKLYGHHIDGKETPELISIWIVARFFQSLYINIKTNNVDISIAEYHLGFLFVWWWRNYYEQAMKKSWPIAQDLADLNAILLKKYPEQYSKWRASAFEDYMKFKGITASPASPPNTTA